MSVDQNIEGDGNKVAAGDITETHLHFPASSRVSQMKRLIELYHEEQKNGGSAFTGFIKKIQHFQSNVEEDVLIGLEAKLDAAGLRHDIPWAKRFKENYAKKLTESVLSPAAQEIHAYLLARVLVHFTNIVLPAINAGQPESVIKALVLHQVIEPVHAELEIPVLDLYSEDINAMIYFLTGNCHINWTRS